MFRQHYLNSCIPERQATYWTPNYIIASFRQQEVCLGTAPRQSTSLCPRTRRVEARVHLLYRRSVAGCCQDVAVGSRSVAPPSRVGRAAVAVCRAAVAVCRAAVAAGRRVARCRGVLRGVEGGSRLSRRRRGLSRRRRGRVAARRAAVAVCRAADAAGRRVARCRGVLRGVEGGSPPITPPSRAGRHPSRRRRGLSRGVAG